MTATTRSFDPTALDDTLCLALELGEGRWKLGFARGFGGKVLHRTVIARDGKGLLVSLPTIMTQVVSHDHDPGPEARLIRSTPPTF